MYTETRTTDAKGRVLLPRSFANATVMVEQVGDTEIRIRKARVVPEDELPFREESIEEQKRPATAEEKQKLARFGGFGPVALSIFPDPVSGKYKDASWQAIGEELKGLLNREEYDSAKRTTFNAFYTSSIVIKAMFSGLSRLGVPDDALALEPGCGPGRFIYIAPEGMRFIGVELDGISGRIIRQLRGVSGDAVGGFSLDTEESERRAMEAVMAVERRLGFSPRDVSDQNLGYDIESSIPGTGLLRFVESKGRVRGSKTVTITKNEILTGMNKPDEFILALAIHDADKTEVRYLRSPFDKEPDFKATSVNYDLAALLAQAKEPE